MNAILQRLWAWGTSSDGMTWLMHALLTLVAGGIGWLLTRDLWGACAVALAYYWAREYVQAYKRRLALGGWLKQGVLRLDDLLDAAFPLWAAGLVLSAARGEWLTFAVALAITVTAVWVLKREKRI